MANPTLGTASLRTALDTSGLQRGLQQSQRETRQAFGQMQADTNRSMAAIGQSMTRMGTMASVTITAPLTMMARSFVQAASDAEETRSKFDTVFKDMAASTRAWANETADSMGRSRVALEGYLASIQDTLVPLGFARDEAAQMSKQVVTLAEDLASFNNLNTADVLRSIQSGIVGNVQNFRQFGVVANEATINQELLNMGIAGGTRAATEQEKALARLNILMAGTADAQGDATRTAGSFANQTRALQAQMNDLAVEFGDILIPRFLQVMESVRASIEWFKGLSTESKTLIVNVAGIAAAMGPVLLVGGAMARSITGITAAARLAIPVFHGLRAAMLFMGPAGLVFAAAGLVASLAATFGNAKDKGRELTEGMEPLRASMGLVGETTRALRQEVRDYADDLRVTSQAEYDAAKAFVQAAKTRAAVIREELATLTALTDRRRMVEGPLGDILDAVIGRMTGSQAVFDHMERENIVPLRNELLTLGDALAAAERELENFENGVIEGREPLGAFADNAGRAADNVVSAAGRIRLAADVFKDLERAGTLAAREAALWGDEAEGLSRRLDLVRSALRDLLTTPDATNDQISYLIKRAKELQNELIALGEGMRLASEQYQDTYAPSAGDIAMRLQRVENMRMSRAIAETRQLSQLYQEAYAPNADEIMRRLRRLEVERERAIRQSIATISAAYQEVYSSTPEQLAELERRLAARERAETRALAAAARRNLEYQESRIAGEALVAREAELAANRAGGVWTDYYRDMDAADEANSERRKQRQEDEWRLFVDLQQARVRLISEQGQAGSDFGLGGAAGRMSGQVWVPPGFDDLDNALRDTAGAMLDLAQSKIPGLSSVIHSFGQGPLTGIAAIFHQLLTRSEGLTRMFTAFGEHLGRVADMLSPLFDALSPLVDVAFKLAEVALKPLAWVLENIVTPVFTAFADAVMFVVNGLLRLYNMTLGRLFGFIPLMGRSPEQPPASNWQPEQSVFGDVPANFDRGFTNEGPEQLDYGRIAPSESLAWHRQNLQRYTQYWENATDDTTRAVWKAWMDHEQALIDAITGAGQSISDKLKDAAGGMFGTDWEQPLQPTIALSAGSATLGPSSSSVIIDAHAQFGVHVAQFGDSANKFDGTITDFIAWLDSRGKSQNFSAARAI